MDRWAGRVALVTGASSGIGAGICRALVQQGLTVVGCARRAEDIAALSHEDEMKNAPGSLHAIKCDLKVEADILAMFQEIRTKFGRLDVCINNAGMVRPASLLEGRTQDWKDVIDVNVMALCICSREAVKLMKETSIEEGQIIHINSTAGHYIPPDGVPGAFIYCGTKFMVRALTEGLRRELKVHDGPRIRVSSVSPGVVKTNIFTALGEDMLEKMTSSMEVLMPKDVAECVLHILSRPSHVEVHDVIVRPYDQTF